MVQVTDFTFGDTVIHKGSVLRVVSEQAFKQGDWEIYND